jgi:hypothetical protein
MWVYSDCLLVVLNSDVLYLYLSGLVDKNYIDVIINFQTHLDELATVLF